MHLIPANYHTYLQTVPYYPNRLNKLKPRDPPVVIKGLWAGQCRNSENCLTIRCEVQCVVKFNALRSSMRCEVERVVSPNAMRSNRTLNISVNTTLGCFSFESAYVNLQEEYSVIFDCVCYQTQCNWVPSFRTIWFIGSGPFTSYIVVENGSLF